MATTAKALAKQNYNLNQQLLAARSSQNHRTRKELNATVKLTRELDEKLNASITSLTLDRNEILRKNAELLDEISKLKRQVAEYEHVEEEIHNPEASS